MKHQFFKIILLLKWKFILYIVITKSNTVYIFLSEAITLAGFKMLYFL